MKDPVHLLPALLSLLNELNEHMHWRMHPIIVKRSCTAGQQIVQPTVRIAPRIRVAR
jgi:hypothetical protein